MMDMYRQELEEFARDTVENGRLALDTKAHHLKETYRPDKTLEEVRRELEGEIKRVEQKRQDNLQDYSSG